jgi:hypothetical protein
MYWIILQRIRTLPSPCVDPAPGDENNNARRGNERCIHHTDGAEAFG